LAVALAAMVFLPPPKRNPADQLKVSVKVMSLAAKRVPPKRLTVPRLMGVVKFRVVVLPMVKGLVRVKLSEKV